MENKILENIKKFREKLVINLRNIQYYISSKKKVVGAIFGIILILISIGAGVYLTLHRQTTKVGASSVALSMVKNTDNVKVGDTFTVTLAIDPKGEKITAADIRVIYDATKLDATKIEPVGNILPVVLSPGKIDLAETNIGRARIVLGAQVNPGTGPLAKKDVDVLAKITFKAKQTGNANISFGPATAVASVGATLDVAGIKNAIQITISNQPQPTANPSPTPSSTPAAASPTPIATPLSHQVNPIGFHDFSDCNISRGWACDANNYNQPLVIHFYYDGPTGNGKFLGSTTANTTREQAVGSNCGGNNNRGFVFTMPDVIKDGKSHTIYAYAINIPAGINPLLINSPKTIKCVR